MKTTPYDEFFWQLQNLDMDNKKKVKELAVCYEIWAECERGECEIDISESLSFQKIIVVHDLFGEPQIEDSWGFLDSVIKVLKLYVENEEMNDNFWRMATFWRRKLNLKNEDIFYFFTEITDLKYENTGEAINDLFRFCLATDDHEFYDRLYGYLKNKAKQIISENNKNAKRNILDEFKYDNSIQQYMEELCSKKINEVKIND